MSKEKTNMIMWASWHEGHQCKGKESPVMHTCFRKRYSNKKREMIKIPQNPNVWNDKQHYYLFFLFPTNEYSGFNRKTKFNLQTLKIQCNVYHIWMDPRDTQSEGVAHVARHCPPRTLYSHKSFDISLGEPLRHVKGPEKGSRNVTTRDLTRYQKI